jgi:acetoin utilization deacetylase AcuC-like enzyme
MGNDEGDSGGRGLGVTELRPVTGFYMHAAAPLHDTGWGHPEHQGRLRTLASAVGKDLLTLHGHVEALEPRAATLAELARVHARDYLSSIRDRVREAEHEGRVLEFAPETPVSDATWEAILGSSGAAIEAVESVANRRFRTAFVATRPPGHHATADTGMGFCLVNHVAVAARHLQATGRARRIAIVDWDVHHGNGTQELFYDDPSVYYLSVHQAPFFPGTGSADERGAGPGEGATRNVPLPAGTDGPALAAALEAALAAAAAEFTPDFVLVSAGFDALAGDPLGGFRLEPADFHLLTRLVLAWADATCEGQVVALLEGGYDPRRTGHATVATLRALARLPVPTA